MKEEVLKGLIPKHVAIIMDGNGRWAKKRGALRIFGHQHGVTAVRDTVEGAAEIGVKFLTLYAFSTENWHRPKEEVDALMSLLVKTINSETQTLIKNKIRLVAIGDLKSLTKDCYKQLMETITATQHNEHMTLVLALSYSARWEITEAVKSIASKVANNELSVENINQETIALSLNTSGIPDPELLIRTSGEYRISNFLLWQAAYTEFYFTDLLWPDFRKDDFYKAILDFQKRERRFGLTNEQIKKND